MEYQEISKEDAQVLWDLGVQGVEWRNVINFGDHTFYGEWTPVDRNPKYAWYIPVGEFRVAVE
jgi:hypothetical protein